MDWLLNEQNKLRFSKIKDIQYFWNNPGIIPHNRVEHINKLSSFSYTIPLTHSQNDSTITNVSVNVAFFQNNLPSSSISSIREKWFLNFSGIEFPKHILMLLQLDGNFSLPPIDKKGMICEFIKNIEHNIRKSHVSAHNIIRNRSLNIINEFASSPFHNSSIDNKLILLMKKSKQFLRNNPNIILTKLIKGI